MTSRSDTQRLRDDLLRETRLEAVHRHAAPALWDEVYAGLSFQPVQHSPSLIDFFEIENGRDDGRYIDASMILARGGRSLGLWPLGLAAADTGWRVTSQGFPISAPLFLPGVSAREEKAIATRALAFLNALCRHLGQSHWHSREAFLDAPHRGLTAWHQAAMQGGAQVRLVHDLYVDLTLAPETLRAQIRKSFKPLISKGRKLWSVTVDRSGDAAAWEELRQLHIRVAGRVTRPKATWDRQFLSLQQGHAMAIYLRDNSGRLVGAGYFTLTRDEANYSIGVYDRSLFDQPLGHVVQMQAIEELTGAGRKWLRLGERPFADWHGTPDAKALSIGAFKQGFATHWQPVFDLIGATTAT